MNKSDKNKFVFFAPAIVYTAHRKKQFFYLFLTQKLSTFFSFFSIFIFNDLQNFIHTDVEKVFFGRVMLITLV